MDEKKKVSPGSTSIYGKLLDFQKLNISIKKDMSNPHFRSKYADLSEVINKVRKPLSDCGIVLIQSPTEFGLTTTLHDVASGTEITSFLPFIGASDPQKLGSNLTYLRRYSLVTILGLEDDDDDGNTATAPTQAKSAPKPTPAPTMTIEEAFVELHKSQNLDQLKTRFMALPASLRKDNEVVALKDELKTKLTNA